MKFPIPKDKAAHAAGCAAIAGAVGMARGPVDGFLAAMGVGVLKEIVDLVRKVGGLGEFKGRPMPFAEAMRDSLGDLLADLVGAACGSGGANVMGGK